VHTYKYTLGSKAFGRNGVSGTRCVRPVPCLARDARGAGVKREFVDLVSGEECAPRTFKRSLVRTDDPDRDASLLLLAKYRSVLSMPPAPPLPLPSVVKPAPPLGLEDPVFDKEAIRTCLASRRKEVADTIRTAVIAMLPDVRVRSHRVSEEGGYYEFSRAFSSTQRRASHTKHVRVGALTSNGTVRVWVPGSRRSDVDRSLTFFLDRYLLLAEILPSIRAAVMAPLRPPMPAVGAYPVTAGTVLAAGPTALLYTAEELAALGGLRVLRGTTPTCTGRHRVAVEAATDVMNLLVMTPCCADSVTSLRVRLPLARNEQASACVYGNIA
jgi:hypothetical protein